jgi:hypothetical protein
MGNEMFDVGRALKERRLLSKEDRDLFERPAAVTQSRGDLIHWTLGIIIQDKPALVMMAALSLFYYAVIGINSVYVLVAGK